ncbi:MAG: glutamine--fructose-6-phosphate transaminase (isomerizing) [Oscillospiraceae bacterium]|jgi:glucosamine--fructose-6-phosphate aminotransferase (isomerizing)|nr:glutamine--fructose-6-phosphate transaminase (isomerizing) [Oscillospiraceae bacterium]
MCGIVGYIGPRQAVPILMEGLARLEYRGYDSAGLALIHGGQVSVRKAKGRLDNLRSCLQDDPVQGTCGVGHTRWATHGEPSQINSHPHTDVQGSIAVVHNGIIENYESLKEYLAQCGVTFRSQTDTEVVAHLIHHLYQGDPVAAIRQAMHRMQGSYALAIVCGDTPDTLFCVRKDSPLVVGWGDGEQFLASDIPAMLPFTRDVYPLEDGEIAVLTTAGIRVLDAFGQPKDVTPQRVDWDVAAAEKGGYPHFMLKEIYEQPKAFRDTLHAYVDAQTLTIRQERMPLDAQAIRALSRVKLVACGTAYHAGMVGKALLERLAGLPAEADIASEFRYRDVQITPDDLCVVISQSGETADTLAAMRKAKQAGARVVAVTNVVGSTVSREADDVLYTLAGPEIAVASTKAYTTQLLVLSLLALHMAQARGNIDETQARALLADLLRIPEQAEQVLANRERIQRFASLHYDQHNVYYIGRGLDWALALEGSLKLKEISYTFSEAYAAGELKHGTIALIEPGTVVVALCTQPALLDKMRSNIEEVRARGARVLCVAQQGLPMDAFERWDIPQVPPEWAPVLTVLPLQLYAYYVAVAKGCDVDKPRNLAKSVTVE